MTPSHAQTQRGALAQAIASMQNPLPISEMNLEAISRAGGIPIGKVRVIVRLTVLAMAGLLLEPETADSEV